MFSRIFNSLYSMGPANNIQNLVQYSDEQEVDFVREVRRTDAQMAVFFNQIGMLGNKLNK